MSLYPASLVLVGAGKMGGAMLQGWLKGGLAGTSVTIRDPAAAPEISRLSEKHGIRLNPPVEDIVPPDVLVLAIKPQMLESAAPLLAEIAGPKTLVISILAGKTIADLAARMPQAQAFIRAMPNTPAAVGRGITGVAASPAVTDLQKRMADKLLHAVGRVEWLDDEALIDAVTALSGSGPAYVFYLVECMARAGAAIGLPEDVARRMARATVEGAGELMFQERDTEPGQLRVNVTSPGGTTAAALAVLMADGGLAPLMEKAICAAKKRAEDLAG